MIYVTAIHEKGGGFYNHKTPTTPFRKKKHTQKKSPSWEWMEVQAGGGGDEWIFGVCVTLLPPTSDDDGGLVDFRMSYRNLRCKCKNLFGFGILHIIDHPFIFHPLDRSRSSRVILRYFFFLPYTQLSV